MLIRVAGVLVMAWLVFASRTARAGGEGSCYENCYTGQGYGICEQDNCQQHTEECVFVKNVEWCEKNCNVELVCTDNQWCDYPDTTKGKGPEVMCCLYSQSLLGGEQCEEK
jgi:hypothetical protein